jgi:hypothetical protein
MRWSEFRESLTSEGRESLRVFLFAGVNGVREALQFTEHDGTVADVRFQLTLAIDFLEEARRMLPEA